MTIVDIETGEILMDEEAATISMELSSREAIIERGLTTFVEVGQALMEIRDQRLYCQNYRTFEEYCHERWAMSRPRVYQLIDAARVTGNLSTIVDKLPSNESQARPLAPLDPDTQRALWQTAVETAPNGKLTAAHVQTTVDEYTGKQKPHVTHNSGENEWYTPPVFIEAARQAMGGIDLDPASSEIANQTVQASTFYSTQDDGRSARWFGRVWMNPPYAQPLIAHFAERVSAAFERGEIEQACVLVNNATETTWFQTMLESACALCLVRGRVKFIDPDGNASGAPLQGQVVLYFGNEPVKFANAFGALGVIAYVR